MEHRVEFRMTIPFHLPLLTQSCLRFNAFLIA